MEIQDVDVAVIYTDGSHLMNPPGTGAGIHGYLFNHGTLDDNLAYSYNGATEHVTTTGYKKFPADVKVPEVPESVQFIDAIIPVQAHHWSDVAELTAFITLFEAAPFRAKNYIIYVDAAYVVNAWNEWMTGWKARGWVKADGSPIGNREYILKLDEIKERMRSEGRSVRVIKIKGHSGRYGNERADSLAGKASAMVAAGQGVEYRPYWMQEESLPEAVEEQPTLGDDITRFPILATTVKYTYPMANETPATIVAGGETWNYILAGQHAKGKEDVAFVGKMIPDAHFAMFFTKESWHNAYELVNIHNKRAWDGIPALSKYDPMAIVYNDYIKRKKFVDAIKAGLTLDRLTLTDNNNVCMFEDLLITRLIRPPLLSYRALGFRDELAAWLRDTVDRKTSVVLNDITDMLFDEAGKPRKDFYRNVDRSFTVQVGYPESDKTVPVILTRGIDLPGRTEINRVKEPGGRYYVVTRREQPRCVEYAVVYLGSEYHALWCGYYANKRILKEDEV